MEKWKIDAQRKKDQLINVIPNEWRIPNIVDEMRKSKIKNAKKFIDTLLPSEEIEITNLSISKLAQKISNGEYSCYKVCFAFCHRTAMAHQILNCCTEIFFDEALDRAKLLDEEFKKTGKIVGPLHGVPISLKDQVNIPGVDTNIGYVGYVGQKAETKSLLAQVLEENGAILYVKTTVPMAMMAPDTISNLHGTTLNAINIDFSCGGSSGGEGSLIGSGASVLGVGTDIGGSIRIPAAFQGLYALRPSYGRIPYMNVSNSYVGQELIPSVIGPLASSLEACELFTKTVVNANTWHRDPKIVPLPWRDMSHLRTEKLRFAVMWWDHDVMVHPPVTRALKTVVDHLNEEGHQVIEWNFKHHKNVLSLATRLFAADNGKEIQDTCNLANEPVVECVKDLVGYDPVAKPLSVEDWWQIGKEKSQLMEKFLDFWMETSQETRDGEPIDALICPIWPSAGFKQGESEYAALNYTVPINLLDCCSVIIPITTVNKNLDKFNYEYQPVSALDKKIHEYYNPDEFHGMPVCVQIVCKRLEEEKVLQLAKLIVDYLKLE